MYFLDSLHRYGRGKIKFKSRICFMFMTLRVMGKENTNKKIWKLSSISMESLTEQVRTDLVRKITISTV